jgi:hypothetical protein
MPARKKASARKAPRRRRTAEPPTEAKRQLREVIVHRRAKGPETVHRYAGRIRTSPQSVVPLTGVLPPPVRWEDVLEEGHAVYRVRGGLPIVPPDDEVHALVEAVRADLLDFCELLGLRVVRGRAERDALDGQDGWSLYRECAVAFVSDPVGRDNHVHAHLAHALDLLETAGAEGSTAAGHVALERGLRFLAFARWAHERHRQTTARARGGRATRKYGDAWRQAVREEARRLGIEPPPPRGKLPRGTLPQLREALVARGLADEDGGPDDSTLCRMLRGSLQR